MALYTLQFTDFDQARAVATALGFWDTEADQLRTDGQSQDARGNWFGWNIDEIGPVEGLDGYFCNVTGQLPPGAADYLAPHYGYAGRFYAGAQEPQPHPSL
jgi:hypothetical protein